MSRRWIHKCYCTLFLFLLYISLSSQDNYANPLDVLIIQLEDALEKGNPRAIYEFAGIIDEVEHKDKIISLLDEHTLFPKDQLLIDKELDRERLLGFLNNYDEQIVYSPILKVFVTTPIEGFTTDYEITRKRNLSDKEKSSLLRRYIDVLNATSTTQLEVFAKYQLKQIAKLQNYESYDFLLGCLEGRNLPVEFQKASFIEANICEALTSYDDPYVLEIILEQLKKGKIDSDDAERMLSKFTNVKVKESNPKKMAKKYMFLMDSLGTLSGVRKYGFENESTIRLSFFEEPVDYYAYMLSQFYDNPWMRENALREMLATGNPRSLFYLSAVLFAQRESSALDRRILENQFNQFLNISIYLKDGNDELKGISDQRKDKQFYLNHAIYWSTHYSDYEYDMDRRIFVNVKLEEENEESATRLFKKLTSDNDKAALESFKELSRYPPGIISRLYTKYQTILRRSNPNLPDFRYGFLENIAMLEEFCEVEGIEVELPDKIQTDLELLKETLQLQERYNVENRIIRNLELNDLTALEIEGLIFSKNIDFNFSVSRILDIFYSRNLDQIISSDLQLRLFFKKSVLFSSIGVGGISNKYYSKLDMMKEKIQSKIFKISKKEYDEDIRDAISYMLPEDEGAPVQAIPIEGFISNPLEFGSREFQLIEAPNTKSLKLIFKEINSKKDPEKILRYIEYLTLHTSELYTPYLLSTLKNPTVLSENDGYKRTVTDAAVLLLENIYNYSFSEDDEQPLRDSAGEWYAFSKQNKNYKNWNQILFNRKVDEILSKEQLVVSEFNTILKSDFMNDKIIGKCLAAIHKLNKPNDIRRLRPTSKFPVKYLPYFKKLDFNEKYLDDVLELFENENTDELWYFIDEYVTSLTIEQKGKTYNRVCDLKWFIPSVLEMDRSKINEVINSMNTYLDNSDFISQFEEARVLNRVFLLSYGKLSLIEQLKKSNQYIQDEEQIYNIQQNILKKASYQELVEILDNSDLLIQKKGESNFSFLESKLGLPSYLFDTEKNRKEFKKDLNQLSEVEIYSKYLSLAGLDVFNEDKTLDYEKVREVLEFDIVVPFSSTVSRSRIHYARGILGLLNSIYPENPFEFTTKDDLRYRSKAWINYLKEEGVLDRTTAVFSFNHND